MSFEAVASGITADAMHIAPFTTDPDFYAEPKDYRRELKRAQTICLDLSASTHELINNVRVGRPIDIDLVLKPLTNMVNSVIRHPCAFVWVARLQNDNDYSFSHSVRCAVFSTVIGRRMGLPLDELVHLALGSLLCQIGKTKLPRQLLEKQGQLSASELDRIREHVQMGVSLLRKAGNVAPQVIDVVQHHCERFDGSGFPQGSRGDGIPLLARIAGLVDTYDAMTSVKPHTRQVMSCSEAVKHLFRQRNVLFQGELVEELNHALGFYNTGSLVELSNGQVALVERQNENSRLLPHVLIVQDEHGDLLERFISLDLKARSENSRQETLSVICALGVNEFRLSPTELMREYSRQKGLWRRLTTG